MAKGKKGKLRHIRIETGANGYSVHAHHDMNEPSDMPAPMRDDKPMFFQKKKHVLDHVNSIMSEHEGEPDGDEAMPPKVPANHPLNRLKRKSNSGSATGY